MGSDTAEAPQVEDAGDATATEGAGTTDPEDVAGGPGEDGVRSSRPLRPARPWGRIAAFVSLLYVAWYVVGLVVLRFDAGAYNALNRFYGGVGARAVLCLVLLAVLFHLLDGVRVTAQDAIPRLAARELALRTTVRFVLLAVWIPASVAILWPAIRSWFSR